MKIPAKGTAARAITDYLNSVGTATKEDCANLIIGHMPQTIRNALGTITASRQLILADGSYSLCPTVKALYEQAEGKAQPVVQPAVINRFTPAMTGYEAAMRRNVRDDAPLADGHYINGGSTPEPFRGGVKP